MQRQQMMNNLCGRRLVTQTAMFGGVVLTSLIAGVLAWRGMPGTAIAAGCVGVAGFAAWALWRTRRQQIALVEIATDVRALTDGEICEVFPGKKRFPDGLDPATLDLVLAAWHAARSAEAHRTEARRLGDTLQQRIEEATHRVRTSMAQLSHTDPLTGLGNRRGFDEKLKELIPVARRDGREVALLAVDLDHFKQINDTCGHDRGDEALEALGEAIKSVIRDRDIAGRIGGDEIMVALPGANREQAHGVAERIAERFAAHRAARRSTMWPTLSIGVAMLIDDDAGDGTQLRRMADRAMYASKHMGRDRCTAWTRDLEPLPRSA